MGEGWTPTSIPLLTRDATAANSLLLSHTSTRSRSSTFDAAYALSLFGECAVAARLNVLAAAALVQKTQPIFPVVVLLGERCWESEGLVQQLRDLGAKPIPTKEIRGVKCTGRRYGPDSRMLPANVTGSYFDATYTILAAWNLVQYRAVLVLDSDLVVTQNLVRALPRGCCCEHLSHLPALPRA